MAVSKNPLKAVDFSSVDIKSKPVKAVQSNNTFAAADWSGAGDGAKALGAALEGASRASKNKGVEGNLEVSKDPVEAALKTIRTEKTNLQNRINTAKSQGKEDKVARLEGKQERRDVRQKSRAEIITAKNVDKKAKTEANQANKKSKFNEKQIEKGRTVTKSPTDTSQKESKKDESNKPAEFTPVEREAFESKTGTGLFQKLGSTGKGFKLKAFRSN